MRKLLRESNEANDRGATAVEYAILASLIAAVIAATVTLVGLDTLANFESVG
jgi:Flp pilus assembly pilin Flp